MSLYFDAKTKTIKNKSKVLHRYCEKHMCSDGFIDENGRWVCWVCYKVNPFNYPRGRVIEEFKRGNITLRLVDRSTSLPNGMQEVEQYAYNKRTFHQAHKDLSVATRKFNSMKQNIIAGIGSELRVSDEPIPQYDSIEFPSSDTDISDPEVSPLESPYLINILNVLPHINNPEDVAERSQEEFDELFPNNPFNQIHESWYFNVRYNRNSITQLGLVEGIIENTFITNSDLVECTLRNCTLHSCRLYRCTVINCGRLGTNVLVECDEETSR